MNYRGVIIEESLLDTSILKEIRILETNVYPVTEEHKTPWLEKWTLHKVEVLEEEAEKVAEELSKVINDNPSSWYADFKNEKWHYIIFPNKIFKVDLSDPVLYREAKKHGISLGIPEYQVDFVPDDLKTP